MKPLAPEDPSHIGPYRLIARLGSGGMGRVYLARSKGGRTVAVKLVHADFALHPAFRRRFAREVGAARKVGGEWTAPVLDADTEAKNPWVATGYVPGPPLNQVVDGDFGPLPSASVHVLAHRLALALQAIHEEGLVHRDLKPANILLTVDGPRVIDFGLARGYTASLGGSLTEPGTVLGTPAFMSPEQVRGETLTQASDLFSLGSVLVYAATGRLAFQGSEPINVMYHIAHEDPDLSGIPDELVDPLGRCLAKSPEQRPSLRELLDLTRHAVARAWLPAELLVRLGRDAARLLDAEAHLAESEPLAAVSVPTHATTSHDLRAFDYDEVKGPRRDLLDVPEAGITPPSIRSAAEPRRRPWLRCAGAATALALAGALLVVPSLRGLAESAENADSLQGSWNGKWILEEWSWEIRLTARSNLVAGRSVHFIMSHGSVTCWGESRVLSRDRNTVVLGKPRWIDTLPRTDSEETCILGDRQTLSVQQNGSAVWKWSRPGVYDKSTMHEVEVTLTTDGQELLPAAYSGTWDDGRGMHLTIHGDAVDAAGSVSVLDTRSGARCVWHANVFTVEANHDILYGPLYVDREVSDRSCRRAGLHRARLSPDGYTLSVSLYQEDTEAAPTSETAQLQRVG
ncbi:serine/threonine-protein kinase [Streptomyces sp. MA5143a]|uniref:serine/threonine-protein kinase n=1 Tax=Streptomyces sp. MA5143a TaxID=2083010 RepID=UPI000D1AB286|nr:serine/threonine-protein kinase [Streptomyces sp. MA5143a]SPF06394.1 Serine/threonine-protein kinase AfsK [Streptomyces sp. MA5143a]